MLADRTNVTQRLDSPLVATEQPLLCASSTLLLQLGTASEHPFPLELGMPWACPTSRELGHLSSEGTSAASEAEAGALLPGNSDSTAVSWTFPGYISARICRFL